MALNKNTTTIVKGIITVLLLLCLIDADYGFYQAMRTLISFGFAFLTYRYYQTGNKTNAVIYLCLLVVFQPLMKIGLGRAIWIVVDIIVAIFLIYQMFEKESGKVGDTKKSPSTPSYPENYSKPSNSIKEDKDFIDDHMDKYSKF